MYSDSGIMSNLLFFFHAALVLLNTTVMLSLFLKKAKKSLGKFDKIRSNIFQILDSFHYFLQSDSEQLNLKANPCSKFKIMTSKVYSTLKFPCF